MTEFYKNINWLYYGYWELGLWQYEIANLVDIEPFSYILKVNNITNFEEAWNCEDLWNIENGRTLCKECHEKTETFGNGAIRTLNEIIS